MQKKLSTQKKIVGVIFLLVITFVFFVAGQYLGGRFFFMMQDMDKSTVTIYSLYQYSYYYLEDDIYKKDLVVCLIFSGVFTFLPIFVSFVVVFLGVKERLFGAARFASDIEIKRSGLIDKKDQYLDKDGINKPPLLLGKVSNGSYKNQFLKYEGVYFVGVGAGTRAGKGISFVLPNLVNYQDSVVCLDIKLENFEKSAGFREKAGQEVYLFCPDGYQNGIDQKLRSHSYNPFDAVRVDEHRTYIFSDIQRIANTVYPLSGKGGESDMWNNLAQSVFIGLSLWMFDVKDIKGITPSFPYLYSILGFDGSLENWMQNEINIGYLSKDTEIEFSKYIDSAAETRGSIYSTFVAPLTIFNDKTCIAATSETNIDLSQLRKKRMSIYVGVNPDNMARYKFLLNIFFEQVIGLNTRTLPERDRTLKYQCLVLFDEFARLGRLPSIVDAVGYAAGYNVRFAFVYQDNSQLRDPKLYGREGTETILQNLGAELFYPPKKVTQDVKDLSVTLGTKTVKNKTRTITRSRHASNSTNTSDHKRELMMPQEIVEFGKENMCEAADVSRNTLLLKEYLLPMKIEKIISFEHERINERIKFSKENKPEIPILNIGANKKDENLNMDNISITSVSA